MFCALASLLATVGCDRGPRQPPFFTMPWPSGGSLARDGAHLYTAAHTTSKWRILVQIDSSHAHTDKTNRSQRPCLTVGLVCQVRNRVWHLAGGAQRRSLHLWLSISKHANGGGPRTQTRAAPRARPHTASKVSPVLIAVVARSHSSPGSRHLGHSQSVLARAHVIRRQLSLRGKLAACAGARIISIP
jgi:hypothetical protein